MSTFGFCHEYIIQVSNAEIARLLCRSKSSIGRELLRNSVEQRETIHTNSKSADIPLHKTIHRYMLTLLSDNTMSDD